MKGRAAWLVVAQGASSLSNLALTIMIARESSLSSFAAFALAMPIYAIVNQFSRIYLLVPREIALNDPRVDDAGEPPINASIVSAVLFAVVVLVMAAAIGGTPAIWLASLAAALPGLALYDCVRNELISTHAMPSRRGSRLPVARPSARRQRHGRHGSTPLRSGIWPLGVRRRCSSAAGCGFGDGRTSRRLPSAVSGVCGRRGTCWGIRSPTC